MNYKQINYDGTTFVESRCYYEFINEMSKLLDEIKIKDEIIITLTDTISKLSKK